MTSFPNLLIIGAMKSGTTSLHDYLNKHPDIYMSSPKEIHYYSGVNKISESEYIGYFDTQKNIKGTSPQSYTKAHYPDFKNIPEKIYKDSPDVKLIYIVRDPFERILSHVLENRFGDDLKKIEKNLEIGHHWKTSLYYYQISEYLKCFNKSNIHILTLEGLKKDKLNELNKVFTFLGVKKLNDESIFDYIKNDASTKEVPLFIKVQIWFRILNRLNASFAKKAGKIVSHMFYREFLKKPRLETIIDDIIVKRVREDSIKLEQEFGVDISSWNLHPKLN